MVQLKILLFFILSGIASQGFGRSLKTRAPQKLFLTIGIDSYEEPYWRDLNYAGKDAKDMASSLKPSFDGGWTLVSNEESNVTQNSIKTAFDRLNKANVSEADTVIVYLSGHGTIGKAFNPKAEQYELQKFVVTWETNPEDPISTGLSHQTLIDMFSQLKSRKKVLILDTCYSGGGKSRLTNKILQLIANQKSAFPKEPTDLISEGSIILAASAWGEEALESKDHKNGLYTHFLIEGFDKDFNGDGAVSITEAHTHATSMVVKSTGGAQHPTAKIEVVGQDPIIVKGSVNKSHSPYLFAYEWVTRRFDIAINGISKGAMTSGGMEVPVGRVRLTITDPKTGNTLVDRFVTFKEGEEYSASSLIYPTTPHSMSIAATLLTFANGSIRNKYAPSAIPFLNIDYRFEDAIYFFDLFVSLSYAPEKEEKIKSDDILIRQLSRNQKLSLGLSRRHEFRNNKANYQTGYLETSLGLGLTLLRTERRLKALEFIEPKQEGIHSGISFTSQTAYVWPRNRWKVGALLSAHSLSNQFPFGPQQLVAAEMGLFFATFW